MKDVQFLFPVRGHESEVFFSNYWFNSALKMTEPDANPSERMSFKSWNNLKLTTCVFSGDPECNFNNGSIRSFAIVISANEGGEQLALQNLSCLCFSPFSADIAVNAPDTIRVGHWTRPKRTSKGRDRLFDVRSE